MLRYHSTLCDEKGLHKVDVYTTFEQGIEPCGTFLPEYGSSGEPHTTSMGTQAGHRYQYPGRRQGGITKNVLGNHAILKMRGAHFDSIPSHTPWVTSTSCRPMGHGQTDRQNPNRQRDPNDPNPLPPEPQQSKRPQTHQNNRQNPKQEARPQRSPNPQGGYCGHVVPKPPTTTTSSHRCPPPAHNNSNSKGPCQKHTAAAR